MSENRNHIDTQPFDDEMRRYFEQQAGLVLEGPDTDTVSFTLNNNTYSVNYVVITIGGLAAYDQARNEAIRYVMAREFIVLGNPVRLQRPAASGPSGMPPPSEGYPQGPILLWRAGGHTPHFHVSDSGVWEVHMSYAVLPPFVYVEGMEGGTRSPGFQPPPPSEPPPSPAAAPRLRR